MTVRAEAPPMVSRLTGPRQIGILGIGLGALATRAGGPQEIEQLLALRTPIYRACATLEVDTEGKAPADIADEIVAALR